MKSRFQDVTLAVLLVAATTGAAAQVFEEPSHPLSQINPIDVPLDMSNEEVRNVSVLSLSNPSGDGFRLDNYRIADTTGTNQLRLDPAQNQFQVQGSELNLSGNNLTAPKNIKTGGQTVTLRDSTGQQDVLRAREGGNLEVPSGRLRLSGNENLQLGSGSNIQALGGNNNLLLNTAGGGSDRITLRDSAGNQDILVANEGGEIDIPSGNLDVSGNNITSIDTLEFEKGTSIDGELTVDGSTNITGDLDVEGSTNVTGGLNISGDLDLGDNDLEDVRSITGGGDAVEFENRIDLNENTALNVNALRDNTGTNTVQFRSNSVEIPNGNLSVNGQFQSQVAQSGAVRLPYSAAVKARTGPGGNDIGLIGTAQNRDVRIGFDDGTKRVSVESDLNLAANDIRGVGGPRAAENGAVRLSNAESINFRSSEDDADFGITGTTDEIIDIRNTAGNDVARFKDTGDVGIPNGNVGINTDNPQEKVQIKGGSLRVDNSNDGASVILNRSDGSEAGLITGTQGAAFQYAEGDIFTVLESSTSNVMSSTGIGTKSLEIDSGNNVRVPNGNIRLSGNNVVSNVEDNMRLETQRSLVLGGDKDSDGTGEVAIQTQGDSRVFVTNSGQLEVQDNDLDLQGNSVVDDTSSNTVSIGDGADDNVRLETGGEDVDVPDGQVDVNSPSNTGRTVDVGGGVNADGDLKTFSGNVASDQRMCIGDRCA